MQTLIAAVLLGAALAGAVPVRTSWARRGHSVLPDNRTPMETMVKYSREETKCFAESKVYYRGECRELNERGVCREGEWLVLDERVVPGVRPVCRWRLCSEECTFWPATRDCRRKDDPRLCPHNSTTADDDEFGVGRCKCVNLKSRMHTNGKCYPLHTKGPCSEGRIFTVDRETGKPSCREDPCRGGEPGQLFVEEAGGCFPRGGRGPCQEGYTLEVYPRTGRPACVPPQTIFLAGGVVDCATDLDGNCVDGVDLDDKGEQYLQSLLEAAKKKKQER